MGNILYSGLFKELTQYVQPTIDRASEEKKRLFSNTYFEEKLTWGIPQTSLAFEQLLGRYMVDIAASTIGDDSPEPIRPNQGLETFAARVLKHAHTYSMTTQEYRQILSLLNSRALSDTAVRQQMLDIMFGNIQTAVNGVNAKIDMIFLGLLSNEGIFEFNEDNNPGGGWRGKIDFKMPDENKMGTAIAWTPDNAENVDVLEALQAMQEKWADKTPISEAWVSQSMLNFILRNKSMKQVIFGVDRAGSILLQQQFNAFMQENGLPTFRVVQRQTRVMLPDGSTKTYTPFNGNNIVFLPEGNLGTVVNAFADGELRQEPGIAYSNAGRILISQWGAGKQQNSNGVEFVSAESLSLPVLTEIEGIYSLNTEGEA